MRVIDAFAGIGGFSLAADALGWETVAFVERDPDCQFWLGQHWPGVPIYGDICAVRWEDAPPCDVFTAGFPCQPHSVAGKRQASADDRDLWSECVRAIGVLRPRYAVLENVPGLLTSESGRFFNRVLSDLAALGYVGRYDVLSAAECGAPHKRERVWIVAHPDGRRCEQRHASQRQYRKSDSQYAAVGDTEQSGWQGCAGHRADSEGRRHGAEGSAPASRLQLRHAWADAIPYRGADGTVRLIPRGAVAESSVSGLSERDGTGIGTARSRDAESEHSSGFVQQEEVEGPEPALRLVVARLSRHLVGCNAPQEGEEEIDADASKEARPEALRDLWATDGTQTDQRSAGRCGCISAATALLAFLRELADGSDTIGSQSTSETAARAALRGMRSDRKPASGTDHSAGCSSRRQQSVEQLARELADALSRLPHEVASRAWPDSEGDWPDADGLAGRHAAEEVEAWATPGAQPAGGTAAGFVARKHRAVARGVQMGTALTDTGLQAQEFAGTGGSLWPVTDSEPGRVARLRAVGNAVVPAWVLAGPFRYILDRSSAR